MKKPTLTHSFRICWEEHKGNPLKEYNFADCVKVTIEADFIDDNEDSKPYLELMYVDETHGSYAGGWPKDLQELTVMALALKDMCRGFEVRIDWESIAEASQKWQEYINCLK